jgi:hypothetical protein
MREKWICPRCFEEVEDHPAVSRRDGNTHICSQCGIEEAFVDSGFPVPDEVLERERKFKGILVEKWHRN